MPKHLINKITNKNHLTNNLPKKRPILLWLIIIAIIGGVVFFRFKIASPVFTTITATRTDLFQEVSVTGKVQAFENVDLSFEQAGRINYLMPEGASVLKGQIVATLDDSDFTASLLEARANLKTREAELAGLKAGTKEEELDLERAKLLSSEQSLDIARRNLLNTIRDAESKIKDIFNNKVAGLFLKSNNLYDTAFSIDDYALDSRIRSERSDFDLVMDSWDKIDYEILSYSDLLKSAIDFSSDLNKARSLIDDLNTAFTVSHLRSDRLANSADYWRSIISNGRDVIIGIIDGFGSSRTAFATALGIYDVGVKQLALKESGADVNEVEAKEAQVEAAREAVSVAEVHLSKTILKSPITGIIAKQTGKLWDISAPGSEVISILSNKKFQIEANIPEADISKVAIGSKALVTLDAYGKDTFFSAHIVSINIGETMINNVTTYKTILEFDQNDERIRSGMTANIDIESGSKKGVIAVPNRAIISEAGKKFLNLLVGKKSEKTEIETGFRGSDGMIEIVSGLKDGDLVITSEK